MHVIIIIICDLWSCRDQASGANCAIEFLLNFVRNWKKTKSQMGIKIYCQYGPSTTWASCISSIFPNHLFLQIKYWQHTHFSLYVWGWRVIASMLVLKIFIYTNNTSRCEHATSLEFHFQCCFLAGVLLFFGFSLKGTTVKKLVFFWNWLEMFHV